MQLVVNGLLNKTRNNGPKYYTSQACVSVSKMLKFVLRKRLISKVMFATFLHEPMA